MAEAGRTLRLISESYADRASRAVSVGFRAIGGRVMPDTPRPCCDGARG